MQGLGVKSAERALQVLEVLSRYTRPVPTMVIARECDIPKSSAHRLLNAMRARHFVAYYEAERAWGLGVRALEIGSAYLRGRPLQRLGRPLLVELARTTGDDAHLAILHGTDVLYLDKEDAPQSRTKLITEIGVRLPAHLTAVGRAILAELPDAQLRVLYADRPLITRTRRGPSTFEELIQTLRQTGQAGYAFEHGMVTPGVTCVAAGVRSHEGIPVAALGVSFVEAQRPARHHEAAITAVRHASDRLTATLGGQRTTGPSTDAGQVPPDV